MSRHYSDPEHKWSLTDVEVFYVDKKEAALNAMDVRDDLPHSDSLLTEPGWYYWYCLPGCMPDSDPFGPFDTEEEAIADMRKQQE